MNKKILVQDVSPCVILLCGKPGSGKTTIAKAIENKYTYFTRVSCDEYMLAHYGEIEDKDDFATKLNTTKEYLYTYSLDMLNHGRSVILDWGFWTKAEREYALTIFSKYPTKLVYIDTDDDTILTRLEHRNSILKPGEYYMDKDTFYTLSKTFEVPTTQETHILYSKNIDDIVQ